MGKKKATLIGWVGKVAGGGGLLYALSTPFVAKLDGELQSFVFVVVALRSTCSGRMTAIWGADRYGNLTTSQALYVLEDQLNNDAALRKIGYEVVRRHARAVALSVGG